MKQLKIENIGADKIVAAMAKADIFQMLGQAALEQIASRAQICAFDPDETIMYSGGASDSFFLLIKGEVEVFHQNPTTGDMTALGRIRPFAAMGEIGLLLGQPRTATVRAVETCVVVQFDANLFSYMFENVKAFGPAICRNLALRVQALSNKIPLPAYQKEKELIEMNVLEMIPMDFSIRHRVLALASRDNVLEVGFVDDPDPKVVEAIRRFVPGVELSMVHLPAEEFEGIVQKQAGVGQWGKGAEAEEEKKPQEEVSKGSKRIDRFLRHMVAEGASDLHLSAGHEPRWRIDGDIVGVPGSEPLGRTEVLDILAPVMDALAKSDFAETNDADFIYPLPKVARFRVNLFRDERGVCSVFRFIPNKIMGFEQLGLPMVLKKFCDMPKGLVVVTGPTGSGKSTTLAAMVDYINHTRPSHIITMEDPIEFAHESDLCLVNHREVRRHTNSYGSALRAALREDPDIILVGEMRDQETIALALETANTGHLVFGTLHTSTAVNTISRIIDVFPPNQQNQIRTSLVESLKGVVAQCLCRRVGGGRLAAFEVLVVTRAVANLIREQKTIQIESSMQTGKAQGNRILNDELAKLVKRRKITRDEALSRSVDRDDLISRMGGSAGVRR